MIHRIVDLHQPGAVAAAGFGLSERCACKWLARFRAEGAAGLPSPSSLPQTPLSISRLRLPMNNVLSLHT